MDSDVQKLRDILMSRMPAAEVTESKITEQNLREMLNNGWDTENTLAFVTEDDLVMVGLHGWAEHAFWPTRLPGRPRQVTLICASFE